MKFFWDTFAFIELIKGNEKLAKYIEKEGITSILNVYELVFAILKEQGIEKASFCADEYWGMLIDVDKESIIEASKFKFENRKSGFSYADSMGYVLALKNGAKFLTGDKQFKGLPNVEFIK